jgi:hypothetical protein
MATDNKVIANRKNAKASSGPRSSAGKRRSSRNAVRHGLAVAVESDPAWHDGVEILARILCLTLDDQRDPERCREAARAAIDLLRIRQIRTNILNKLRAKRGADDYHSDLNSVLAKLDRYERRTISRRKRALKFVDAH